MRSKWAKARSFLWHWWKQIILIGLAAGFFACGIFLLWVVSLSIPSFDSFNDRQVTESTKIYDRTGEIVLYDVYGKVRRKVVPFDQISKNLKDATIAIEDDTFYQHHGIKPTAILRAVWIDITRGGTVQGGSTITQQLIKNTILTQDQTIARKVKEWVLALKLERVMSKDQILSLYLNENPYGGSIYGVEEASQNFFGKAAKDLTVAESAYLAAIAKAPTYYSPSGQHRDRLDDRKNLVISRMQELGYLTPDQATAAKKEVVKFLAANDGSIKAPHFVMYVRDYLEKKYGADNVRTKGYKVITTLDYGLQQKAQEVVKQYGDQNAKSSNAENAGLVAINPKNGQILAMVGSRDYFNTNIDGNFNITLAHRQPGSSFKPFVYATAFNKGFTPSTVLFDTPTQFDTNCPKSCYQPSNYDGRNRGPLTLRSALGQSINVPAVKLLYLVGIKDAITTARNMGIESLQDATRYGLSLVLGGGEVTLLEMTSAYGVFANDGVRNPSTPILRIEDSQGKVLEEFIPSPTTVLPTNTARSISSILTDDSARQPVFPAHSALWFPDRQVAVKTGTTNDYKDAWILGYTPSLVVGAWVGNNDNTPMEKRVAGFIVAPLWHGFMEKAFAYIPKENFPAPDPISPSEPPYNRGFWQGNKTYYTDKISGKLATEYTPEDLKEEHVLTQVHSILYWLGRTNDPQFQLWEGPVRAWAAAQGFVDQSESSIPTATDDVHRPEYAPRYSVTTPTPNANFRPQDRVNVQISNYQGRYPIGQLDIFVNDQYFGSVNHDPYQLSFQISDLVDPQPTNTLRVVVYDSVRNKTEQTSTFTISE
jgi:1A family penicillin-binding protein